MEKNIYSKIIRQFDPNFDQFIPNFQNQNQKFYDNGINYFFNYFYD